MCTNKAERTFDFKQFGFVDTLVKVDDYISASEPRFSRTRNINEHNLDHPERNYFYITPAHPSYHQRWRSSQRPQSVVTGGSASLACNGLL
jgi:hypothetical protein